MIRILEKHQKIIQIILEKGVFQSSVIHSEVLKSGEDVSLITIKRTLSDMVSAGILALTGSGRSTRYNLTVPGRVFANMDPVSYCAIDPDKRFGKDKYNFDLFPGLPNEFFDDKELTILKNATKQYIKRTENISKTIQKKELERLIIELSWKSSKIEGNTYTLLDTEKLILENKEAPGHDKNEARMILNHKEAFNFVRGNADEFKTLNRANLEKLHSILVKNMNVGLGFRNGLVGITGSKYQPLDNIHQIREAVTALSNAISKMKTPYSKAFLAILGISYIQPFEDGNKRTSRLMANALLLSHRLAPLSYRSVEEDEYRSAMLVFYELNSIVSFKKIFIEQYEFAANNYAVKPV